MTVNLHDVVVADSTDLAGVSRDVSRRDVLRGLIIAASSAAYLSFSRRAARAHSTGSGGDYNIWPDCSGMSWNISDDDCNGCQQGRVYGGCCLGTSSDCPNGAGFHRHNHGSGYDLRPDECKDSYYDGWRWKPSNCCYIAPSECRSYREWQCHDGYINGKRSICRWVTQSGVLCSPCAS